MDNEVSRTHGWLVTIQRRGVIHRKHFSDGVHGGKQKSFAAAKTYRDEVITKNPPFSMREYSNIVKKNNRSGVVGVCRYCASETRDLPEDKQRWFWVASWPLPDGRRKRVKFSVKKYGEEGAFKMALKARKDALRGLDGAFDPGAVRRKPARRKTESSELRKAA
ncbi:AP2 domain-containing protein [Uliginosibacterium sediminicola]|uniref:AP2 domain-containing protein n=1 Tax=Uliginosibacterium sediminicola TaxID=2024550 RepID=A0ABU9Z057_9RHOO